MYYNTYNNLLERLIIIIGEDLDYGLGMNSSQMGTSVIINM